MAYLNIEHLEYFCWILPSEKAISWCFCRMTILGRSWCCIYKETGHPLEVSFSCTRKNPTSLSPNNHPYLLYPIHSFISKMIYKALKAPSWICIIFSPEWKADWSSGPTDIGALEPAAKGVWSWCWAWSAPLDSGILTLLPISDVDLCIKKEKNRNFCRSDLQMRFVAA